MEIIKVTAKSKVWQTLNKFLPILGILALLLIGSYTGKYLDLQKNDSNINANGQQTLGASNDIYTPFKLEGFGAGWYTQPEYDGADMPNNALVIASNIDYNVRNSIGPRQGTELIGALSTSSYPIYSMHTAKNLQGQELMIRTYNTVLEYWNPNEEEWETLDTGYTANQTFTFAEGNDSDETQVYSYFANGKEQIKRFRVAFGSIASNTATTITLNPVDGYASAADIGFLTTSTIMINGATTTYTGLSGWQLTGLSGLATYNVNEGLVSAVETSGFTSAPASAVSLIIKEQRMYAAYKNLVYASRIDDLPNFSYSAPRVANEGEIVFFPDEGGFITGLGIKQGAVIVFKDDYIGKLEFKNYSTDLSDIPTVTTLSTGRDIGAVNNNSIVNINYELFFVSNDIGPSFISNVANTSIDTATTLGEILRPSLEEYSFTNSAILYDGNFLFSSAQGPDSSFNDRIIIYDTKYKRFVEWTNLNANAFTTYYGEPYYGDAINNNVYKLFGEDYADNGNVYSTNFKTKWYNFNEPTRWKELGWVFVEGFINESTELTLSINLDEGGNLSSKEVTILGTGSYVTDTSSNSSLANNPFGIVNFSNVAGSSDNLKHFVGFINTSDITNKKFRNIQFAGSTSGVGQNYRITKIIPYYYTLDEQYGRSYNNYLIR